MSTHLKTIYRSLLKNRFFFLLNIIGLSIAICSAIVIFQYVAYEMSYDKFHENRLYRVINKRFQGGLEVQNSMVSYSAVGPAMVQDFPEIINQTRVFPFGNAILKNTNQKSIEIARSVAVENSFFSMFSFRILAGDINGIFHQPNELALTLRAAHRLFDSNMAPNEMLDELVQIGNDAEPYRIVAILEDIPANSHLQYDLFMSYETIVSTWQFPQARYDWSILDFRHYVQVAEHSDMHNFDSKLEEFSGRYFDNNEAKTEVFELQSVRDAYLHSEDIQYEIGVTGNAEIVSLLSILALIVLILGWINFINMGIAFGTERMKNVSIKRVLGANTWQVRTYYLVENLTINTLALILGVLLSTFVTWVLMRQGVTIQSLFTDGLVSDVPNNILVTGMSVVLAGIMGSTYYTAKASITSSPLLLLRSKSSTGNKRQAATSRILIIFQFAISLLFAVTGLVVNRQNHHMKSAPLGLDMEDVWVLRQPKLTRADSAFHSKLSTFKNQLIALPDVTHVSSSQRVPGQQLQADYQAYISPSQTEQVTLSYLMVDEAFVPTYGLNLIAGRNFNSLDLANPSKVILNEQALATIGVSNPQEALEKQVFIVGELREVIGIVADFRQRSLQYPLEPLAMIPATSPHHQISLKLNAPEVINEVEQIYLNSFPGDVFAYSLLKHDFEQNYQQVDLANQSLSFFTVVTLLIAGMGLISIASLHLIKRLKELSIRKVLGASSMHLLWMILKRYSIDLGLASLIALPLAFYLVQEWLNRFETVLGLNVWYALIPFLSLLILLVALLSIITLKATAINPVHIIRQD